MAARVGGCESNGRCYTAASPVRPGKERWGLAEGYWNVRDIEAQVFEVLVCRVEVRVGMVASCRVSILSRLGGVEEVHASGRGEGLSDADAPAAERMRMQQEECGRREDKRTEQSSGRERRSWVWAGLWAGSSVVGEIPSRSLQLTTWPGRFSAGLQLFERG